ncbi:hypothetical protein [Streptomyces sp. NPDC087300]|uniref:hypothetical protein n=1 Tax=Streptomyces sp. NPDC087300 TaxID=3365780 RepID=UPI0038221CC3
MDTLLGFAFLAIVAALTTRIVTAAIRKRAAGRAEAHSSGQAAAAFPCRVSWKSGTGRKSSVYGKIHVEANEPLRFARRFHAPLPLPREGTLQTEESWRPGNTVLHFRTADGDIRILANSVDAASLTRAIEARRA